MSSAADTPQDIAEPVREFGLSLKNYIGKGRKYWTATEGEGGGKKAEVEYSWVGIWLLAKINPSHHLQVLDGFFSDTVMCRWLRDAACVCFLS